MNHNRFPLLYMGSDIHKVSPYNGHQPTSATDLGFAIPVCRVLGFAIPLLLLLLTACDPGRHERMQQELAALQAMNQADSLLTDASLAQALAGYFDRHGTPNEQMEAHYLLGRTHADRGEAPAAIDCYQDAADCADTTAGNCDFYMLASVYAQMASLYHQQLLFSYELEAHRKASHYNYLAKDTLHALYEQSMIGCVYILQNKKDSAELLLENVKQGYHEKGCIQEELAASEMLMHVYVEQPSRAEKTKQLIDEFELLSGCIDRISTIRRFYYYKGKYYESVNMLDSAEHSYRKIYWDGMNFSDYDPMYKGLLSVYSKKHNADSIDKYAQLYCAVNDSSIAIKDQELTAQLAASYNYTHYQKQALVNEREATKAKETLIGVILLSCVIISIASILWMRYKRIQNEKHKQLLRTQKKKQQEIERLESEFKDVTEQYNKNKQAVLLLEESYKMTVASVQHRLENAQEVISELNGKYERSIALFKDETDALKKKLSEMNSQKSISELIDDAECFANSSIVLRVRELVEKQRAHIQKRDWEELSAAFATYYPNLVKDLYDINNVTTQEIQTAFLVVLSIRTDDIARLLQVSGQRITNIKSELNLALFGTKSARTLYDNIKSRYGICLLEK